MTSKETLNVKLKAIESDAKVEARKIKNSYNRQVLEELESHTNDIEKNYDIGLINAKEMLKQKASCLTDAINEIYDIIE